MNKRFLKTILECLMKCLSVFLFLISLCSITYGKEIDYKFLYNTSSKAVVLLYGTDGRKSSKGTGSIIDGSGLVLTNTHVVKNQGKLWRKQYVFLKPDNITGNPQKDLKHSYAGKVLAIHHDYDLALVQITSPPDNLATLPLSTLTEIGIGEPAVAIGHPGGGAPWTLTTGKLSASWEDYSGKQGWDLFQTETSLNPGNSGGPLLDGSGSIIGINTFIVRRSGSGLTLTGLNFAIKSTVARKWVIGVLGQLPNVSKFKEKSSAIFDEPQASKALAALPPKPAAEMKKNQNQEKILVPKNPQEQGRINQLPAPKVRKRKEYSSSVKPGLSFSGSELEKLFQRAEDAFEDLDRETAQY